MLSIIRLLLMMMLLPAAVVVGNAITLVPFTAMAAIAAVAIPVVVAPVPAVLAAPFHVGAPGLAALTGLAAVTISLVTTGTVMVTAGSYVRTMVLMPALARSTAAVGRLDVAVFAVIRRTAVVTVWSRDGPLTAAVAAVMEVRIDGSRTDDGAVHLRADLPRPTAAVWTDARPLAVTRRTAVPVAHQFRIAVLRAVYRRARGVRRGRQRRVRRRVRPRVRRRVR